MEHQRKEVKEFYDVYIEDFDIYQKMNINRQRVLVIVLIDEQGSRGNKPINKQHNLRKPRRNKQKLNLLVFTICFIFMQMVSGDF
jgi:hypothetical protein